MLFLSHVRVGGNVGFLVRTATGLGARLRKCAVGVTKRNRRDCVGRLGRLTSGLNIRGLVRFVKNMCNSGG